MGPPDRHLGTNIEKVQTENSRIMWSIHSADYCKFGIVNMKKTLNVDGNNYRNIAMTSVITLRFSPRN